MKACTSLMVEGVGQSRTAATFFSLGRTPSEEILCPRKVTCVRSKEHFCGLILTPVLSSAFNTASRFSSCSSVVRPNTIISS